MDQTLNPSAGILYVVATPIGNLADMVPRAIQILQSVSYIAAEDTRHSAKLLHHFDISTPMQAYHDHSDTKSEQALLHRLANGESVALISDAGTPLISDPGFSLVRKASHLGVKVCPIPGPCALVAALSASGLPSDRFSFEGFLPAKSHARAQVLEGLKDDSRTLIFYESPHRIKESLQSMVEVFGAERELAVAREITKTFETFLRGSAQAVLDQVLSDGNQQKGEFVVMVHGQQQSVTQSQALRDAERVLKILLDEALPVKQASQIAAKIAGVKKNALYKTALSWKAER